MSQHESPGFRIGAVERMTGIPSVTIRMWERRYDAVIPERTSGNGRLYSREQVARLSLLKQLTDAGHAISTIAGLDDETLQARLALVRNAPKRNSRLAKITVIGPRLMARFAPEALGGHSLSLVAAFPSLERAAAAHCPKADVVIIEQDVIDPEFVSNALDWRERVNASRMLVSYHFATGADLKRLERLGVDSLQAPTSASQVAALIGSAGARAPDPITRDAGEAEAALSPNVIPEHRFTPAELARFAEFTQALACECPTHLCDLVSKLRAFEAYSLQCEARNSDDAAIHEMLHRTAARARRAMEDALAEVVKFEGLLDTG